MNSQAPFGIILLKLHVNLMWEWKRNGWGGIVQDLISEGEILRVLLMSFSHPDIHQCREDKNLGIFHHANGIQFKRLTVERIHK